MTFRIRGESLYLWRRAGSGFDVGPVGLRRRVRPRSGGELADPLLDELDPVFGEGPAQRHAWLYLAAQHLDQRALLRDSRQHGGPVAGASRQNRVEAFHRKAAGSGVAVVAGEAVLLQDRQHLVLEVHGRPGRNRGHQQQGRAHAGCQGCPAASSQRAGMWQCPVHPRSPQPPPSRAATPSCRLKDKPKYTKAPDQCHSL